MFYAGDVKHIAASLGTQQNKKRFNVSHSDCQQPEIDPKDFGFLAFRQISVFVKVRSSNNDLILSVLVRRARVTDLAQEKV
jgi:hypothetical protein